MDRFKRRIKDSASSLPEDTPQEQELSETPAADIHDSSDALPMGEGDFSALTDTTPPVFASATTSVDGLSVDVLFTEADSPPLLPATGITGFTVTIAGTPVPITTAVRKGSGSPDNVTVTLTIPSNHQISPGQTITVSYTPGMSPLTDSAPTPNAVATFSTQPVTNIACEHIPPVIASIVTDTTGLILTITFTEAGSPPVTYNTGGGRQFQDGWTILTSVAGGSTSGHTISSTTHPSANVWTFTLSTAITCEMDALASYDSATGTVRDSAAVPNYLASVSSRAITNNVIDTVNPIFGSASASADGTTIDVTIIERCTPPLLPATGATGFEVFVNGIPRPLASAVRVAGTGSGATVMRLTLAQPVRPDDTVILGYDSGTGNVTDSAGTPNPLTAFSNASVSVGSVLDIPPPFFDVIDWVLSGSLASVPTGDILERRVGWPLASVLLDTTPPTGDVVLNEYPNSGGIQCHHFDILDNSSTPVALTAYAVVQDILENTIRQAHPLGGAVDVSAVENIGEGNQFAFVKYLTPIAPATYPTVSAIEFCMTAARAKDYVLEVKRTPDDTWHSLLYLIASVQTLEFFRYTFATPLPLSAVRLRYRGDYYAPTNLGTLTVAGYDLLSDVESVQISHFADFRDATEFTGADGGGWVPFSEGVSLFDWDLINTARVWSLFAATGGSSLRHLISFGTNLIATSSRYVYSVDTGGNVTTVYDAGGSATIGVLTVFQGKVFVGLSTGLILSSPTATSFTSVNPSSLIPPILAAATYGGKLWLGTSADTNGQGALYVWDGSTLQKSRSFNEPQIDSLASASGYLFVGTGGASNQALGKVYYTDGTSWSLTLLTEADNVDTMQLATLDGALWVGLSGGTIYTLTFVSGKPSTWSKKYDQAATHFTDIIDDPGGNFVWLLSDAGVLVYVQALAAFVDCPQPASTTANDMVALSGTFYGAAANGDIYSVDTTTLTTKVRAVYVRYRDYAGNISTSSGVTDTIVQDSQHQDGVRISSGAIHQITPDTISEVATYVSSVQKALFAPDRRLRQSGYYEAEPFYSATLNHWNTIAVLGTFSAGVAGLAGMEQGVQVDLYVRTADTREEVLAADWGNPYTYTTIGNPGNAGSSVTASWNIPTLRGKWLQYKLMLTSASRGYTPIIQAVTLTYTASQATYFFTELFDTNSQIAGPPFSEFRRGLITANSLPNGGTIQFGYTTDPSDGNAFDYTRYTPIDQNAVFDLPIPSRYIRFAILLVTVDSAHPAVVDEFAIQLDAGPDDMYWMR